MLFGPFLSEFGWQILTHVRHVHRSSANRKIVCCRPEDRVLYPSATSFFTDWEHPVPDGNRQGIGANWQSFPNLYSKIKERYSIEEIDDLRYDCHWHTSDLVKPKLNPKPYFEPVDVVCGVRKRISGI